MRHLRSHDFACAKTPSVPHLRKGRPRPSAEAFLCVPATNSWRLAAGAGTCGTLAGMDDLEQKYLELVGRISGYPMTEAGRAAILAEIEAAYRREQVAGPCDDTGDDIDGNLGGVSDAKTPIF